MVTNLFKKIFGSRNERLVKRLSKVVTRITCAGARSSSP